MRPLLPFLLILSACSPEPANKGDRQIRSKVFPDFGFHRSRERLASIEGLFEGGTTSHRNQLCIVERGGRPEFGLVIRGNGSQSCSGAGTARRRGQTVRLTMTGDSPCTLNGRLSGKTLTLATDGSRGCSYYCGGGARFDGVALTQTEGGERAAMKAKDLVGGRLCSGI